MNKEFSKQKDPFTARMMTSSCDLTIPELVHALFPKSSTEDREQINTILREQGIDEVGDLKYLNEEEIKSKLKPVHVAKLMECVHQVQEKENPTTKHSSKDPHLSNDKDKKTGKNLAIASGALGAATVLAAAGTVLTIAFPPVGLPIMIGGAIGAAALATSAAGTGIAAAVLMNKKEPAEGGAAASDKGDEEEEMRDGKDGVDFMNNFVSSSMNEPPPYTP